MLKTKIFTGSISDIHDKEIKLFNYEKFDKVMVENASFANPYPYTFVVRCENDDSFNTSAGLNIDDDDDDDEKKYFVVIPPFTNLTDKILGGFNKVKYVNKKLNPYSHFDNIPEVKTFLTGFSEYLKSDENRGLKIHNAKKTLMELAIALKSGKEQIVAIPKVAKKKLVDENDVTSYPIDQQSAGKFYNFMVTFFGNNNWLWMPKRFKKPQSGLKYITEDEIGRSLKLIDLITTPDQKEKLKFTAKFIKKDGVNIKGLGLGGNIVIQQQLKAFN